MRKRSTIILLGMLCMISSAAFAQTRYLDPVFTDVEVTQNVKYGTNISVLTGAPMAIDLVMDVYEPEGDTLAERPMVLFATSGNFLPRIVNGGPTGTIRDSVAVEICTRLAKMGYVAVSFYYRQGWNPISTDQNVRTSTILQAAYRGIQDARNVVRYFHADADTGGNDFRVDTSRIAIGGNGTGGYVALGAGYLNDFNEVLLPKFFNFDSTPPQPYVVEAFHGNVLGTNTTPLNLPNYVGYSSEIDFVFNLGGAMGDSSWVNAGEPPCVSFHTPLDPFAPYKTGPVIVPTTGDFVVEATGSYDVVRKANELGNNQIFIDANLQDPFTMRANELNDGYEGLFPFDRPFTPGDLPCGIPGFSLALVPEGSPWDWWDEAAFIAAWDAVPGQTVPGIVANCNSKTSNPDMSPTKARTYIDTVMAYLMPRMILALGIDTSSNVSIDNALLAQQLQLFPNPASSSFTVRITEGLNAIRDIQVLDITGRVVISRSNLRAKETEIGLESLTPGLYFVQIRATDGAVTTRKVRKE